MAKRCFWAFVIIGVCFVGMAVAVLVNWHLAMPLLIPIITCGVMVTALGILCVRLTLYDKNPH